jgi:hypothetical protein
MKQYSNIYSRPAFYFVSGLLLMIPVLLIARTNVFYLCYIPLIIGAVVTSGILLNDRDKMLPSGLTRCGAFVAGMIITELIFSTLLILSGKISLATAEKNNWLVLLIELLLGIAVFELFYITSILILFIKNRIHQKNNQ